MSPEQWLKNWNDITERGGKVFDIRPKRIRDAETYAEQHKADKEFADCQTKDMRTARAVFLASRNDIILG